MSFVRKHFAAILAVLIVVVALISIFPPGDDRGFFHRAVVTVTDPIQMAVVSFVDGVASLWKGYVDLVDARREAGELRELNDYLARQLNSLEALEDENARLRRLLGFAGRHPLNYLPTRVIATDILGPLRTVTIGSGKNDGVRVSAPVVNAEGVVGRVVEVYGHFSRVLLLVDPNSSIDGVVKRTGARGIIQGISDKERLRCRFAFSLKSEDIRVGDEVVTSGLGQQFPPGLRLGHIGEFSRTKYGIFHEAVVQPATDVTRLNELLIVLNGKGAR